MYKHIYIYIYIYISIYKVPIQWTSLSLSPSLALSLATVQAISNARGVCVRLTGGGSQVEELHIPIHEGSLATLETTLGKMAPSKRGHPLECYLNQVAFPES